VDRNYNNDLGEPYLPKSPPSRGRGSKQFQQADLLLALQGRPPRGGVDRNPLMTRVGTGSRSRPPRGGVDRNFNARVTSGAALRSPPSRGRGSKHLPGPRRRVPITVAPLAGAWIETFSTRTSLTSAIASPPSRGRGSKQQGQAPSGSSDWSPPSRGRGSKPPHVDLVVVPHRVAPLAGAWIETGQVQRDWTPGSVAPLAGAWIETSDTTAGRSAPRVAPLAGAWIETYRRRPLSRHQGWSPPSRGRGSKRPFPDR